MEGVPSFLKIQVLTLVQLKLKMDINPEEGLELTQLTKSGTRGDLNEQIWWLGMTWPKYVGTQGYSSLCKELKWMESNWGKTWHNSTWLELLNTPHNSGLDTQWLKMTQRLDIKVFSYGQVSIRYGQVSIRYAKQRSLSSLPQIFDQLRWKLTCNWLKFDHHSQQFCLTYTENLM